MSVENRHETAEQPESREQNLEQQHSDNRESRLSDSDLDKVDDNSPILAPDNTSEGSEKDVEKNDEEKEDFSEVEDVDNSANVDDIGTSSDGMVDVLNNTSDFDNTLALDDGLNNSSSNNETVEKNPTVDSFKASDNNDAKNGDSNGESNTLKESSAINETTETNHDDTESRKLDDNREETIESNNDDTNKDATTQETPHPETSAKWYDSLPEGQVESHRGLEAIAKEYVGKEPLSEEDKKTLSDKQYEYLKNRQPEDRDDCRVYTPESIKSVNKNPDGSIRIEQNWKEGTDGAEKGTREMAVIEKGAKLDRIGSSDGRYLSPVPPDGHPYSIEERATGDRLPEQPIEANSCYHQYVAKQDLTRTNIENAIKSYYPSDIAEDKIADLNKYYNDCCNEESIDHPGDRYSDTTGKETDGVKSGKIDAMFRDDDGGGKQYIMPLSASEMCKLGLIEEIKHE